MNFHYIMRSLLFEGVDRKDVEYFLDCIGAEERRYAKGQYIYRAGECISRLGLILEGTVRIESTDAWGERTVHMIAEPGKTFGEAYSCAPTTPLLVDMVANEDCDVLLMDAHRVMHRCPLRCGFHLAIATNLTQLISLRNLELSRRISITAPKSIRGKVLAFLSFEATAYGSNRFRIRYNREQLAEYLSVDRSALSAELSRMKKDGLIDYHMNQFTLLRKGEEETP